VAEGVVTLLKKNKEFLRLKQFLSGGNRLAPYLHRRRPKSAVCSCRNQMALDVEGHWQINRHLASACAKVSHEANFLCSASIST